MTTPTPEQIADDLDAAADVLITDGWCQKAFSDPEGRVCALGAIAKAITGDAYGLIGCDMDERKRLEAASIAAARQVDGHHVPAWNDDPDRVEDDVHDLFRETAKALREQAQ